MPAAVIRLSQSTSMQTLKYSYHFPLLILLPFLKNVLFYVLFLLCHLRILFYVLFSAVSFVYSFIHYFIYCRTAFILQDTYLQSPLGLPVFLHPSKLQSHHRSSSVRKVSAYFLNAAQNHRKLM